MKRFFLLGSSLLLVSTSYAQIGLRAGGLLAGFASSTSNSFHTSTQNKLSYAAGLYYHQQLTKRLSIVPEVLYSKGRMTINRSNNTMLGGFKAAYKATFAYVDVPVLLRVGVGRAFYVEAGPQVGRLVGGHQSGTVQNGTTTYEVNYKVTDSNAGYRRFDAGPCLGVGFVLPAGLGLNVRAYQGLVSLTQDGAANIAHLYRQSLQAALTYQLSAR